MAQWNESEHPRKYDGTFTYKGLGESGTAETSIERVRKIFEARKVEKVNGKSYNVNNDYKEPIQRIKAVAIQRKEANGFGENKVLWAKFYNKLAEIQHGGTYNVTKNGNIQITIEKDNAFYDIIFNGDFESPKIYKIIEYKENEYEYEEIFRREYDDNGKDKR